MSADWGMHRTDWELESQGRLSWNWNRCCWCAQSLLTPLLPSPSSPLPARCITSGLRRKELGMEIKTSDLPRPHEGGKVLWVRT